MLQYFWLFGSGPETEASPEAECINVCDPAGGIYGDVSADGGYPHAGILSYAGSTVWGYDPSVYQHLSKGIASGSQ